MSSEITRNSKKYFSGYAYGDVITMYCYLNTTSRQFFYRSEEILKTENVDHIVYFPDGNRYIVVTFDSIGEF